jgi:hypothetical protein
VDTSINGVTISALGCTATSTVLITPTTNTVPSKFWVEAGTDQFTVKSTEANIWSFNYLVR